MTATLEAPATFVVALTSPPPIKCPPWCFVSYEEHVRELSDSEGFVIHWSKDYEVTNCSFGLALTTLVDGTASPAEPATRVHIDGIPDNMRVDEAEVFASALLSAIKEIRT